MRTGLFKEHVKQRGNSVHWLTMSDPNLRRELKLMALCLLAPWQDHPTIGDSQNMLHPISDESSLLLSGGTSH